MLPELKFSHLQTLGHFSEVGDLSAWAPFCAEPDTQRALIKHWCVSLRRSWSCSFNRMTHARSDSQAWKLFRGRTHILLSEHHCFTHVFSESRRGVTELELQVVVDLPM